MTMQPLPPELPENAELLYKVDDNGKVLPAIIYEEGDAFIHTPENPYCGDPTCPCGGSPPDDSPEGEVQP